MRWAIEKDIRISPIHQHSVDEDINLQKVGGEHESLKNGRISKLKLGQNDNKFEVKIHEIGQTMEKISEELKR